MEDFSELNRDGDKDSLKLIGNENNCHNNQIMMNISSNNSASVNPIKNSNADSLANNQSTGVTLNENGKFSQRRNTIQPNLQPILKKPINNVSTTKPLILPAPISDSGFSQGTKANIVTNMNSSFSTNTVSSQFNCQQQMTMGIATIQPQHFAYSGLSNNRFPYSYSTQQLTLANGGLGTTVQLMPVMNQNNNQMNNSRVQSLPLFMTPTIIGAPSGMLFQPNMTIVPQTSSTMQTINLPNTTYSNDFNHGITIQSQQPVYNSGCRNTAIFTPDFEIAKQETESNKLAAIPSQIVEKTETVINSKINKTQTEIEQTTLVRANVKHRELIRTQIYRMKPTEDPLVTRVTNTTETVAIQQPIPSLPLPEPVLIINSDSKSEPEKAIEIENKFERNKEDTVLPPEANIITNETEIPEKPSLVLVDSSSESDKQESIPNEPVPHIPISLPMKRKLPSPEILEQSDDLRRPYKRSNISEKQDSGQKSPGSLFEKLCKDIPEKQTSMFSNNNRQLNKLTAVVRPEQRKILVHYLDDLIVFESDEPFPTSNKMQLVKSALKAGNIKLNSQTSKMCNDHFLYTNTDDEMSPNQQKQKLAKNSCNLVVNVKPDACMEPLSIDIPTTNTTSSCDSVDSSQVRPLSVCSHQSPTPVPLSARVNKEKISPKKDNILPSPTKDKIETVLPPDPRPTAPQETVIPSVVKQSTNSIKVTPSPVKQVSPIKLKPQKSGLDRPICEWSVNDVADFVKQTPGCDNYVAMFLNHEIDGEALLLLSNDNLIQGALNMKIGPALKLCARIEKRKALDPPQQHQ